MRLRQAAELPQRQSRLAVQVGDRGFLLNLDDVSEVSPVGAITPVPLTQPWFLGVANVRGNLYGVIDFAGFLGQAAEPVAGAQSRLLLFGPRAGNLNAGIVVRRVLGLRNLAELAPAAPVEGARAWYAQRWMDADGRAWQEIDLARLARDGAFLQVGT